MAKKMVMWIRRDVTDGNEGSQQTALGYKATSTVKRKRKAEDSIKDKLTVTAATIG